MDVHVIPSSSIPDASRISVSDLDVHPGYISGILTSIAGNRGGKMSRKFPLYPAKDERGKARIMRKVMYPCLHSWYDNPWLVVLRCSPLVI